MQKAVLAPCNKVYAAFTVDCCLPLTGNLFTDHLGLRHNTMTAARTPRHIKMPLCPEESLYVGTVFSRDKLFAS